MAKGYSLVEDVPQEESFVPKVVRHTARTAARVGETALGLPGDIAQGLLWLGKKGESLLGGKPHLPERAPLPTSQDIKEYGTGTIAKALPKDYLEPQSKGEQFSDEFFSDLTSLAVPLSKAGKIPFKRALAVSGLGNLASFTAKDMGASEGVQTGVKLGTMLATTMAGPGKLKEHMSNLYKNAEQSIPEGAMVSTEKIKPIMDKLTKITTTGDLTPSKKFMLDRINAVQEKMVGGKIPVTHAWALKRDMNEWIHDITKPYGVEKYIPSLSNGLNNVLTEYGKQNKDFLRSFKEADNISIGLSKASHVNKWLQKHVSNKNLSIATAALLFGPHVGVPLALTGKAIVGAGATRYGVQAFEALKNSSAIRKYYADVIGTAAKKDLAATTRNVSKLNKALAKEVNESEPEKPQKGFSLVD